MKKATMDRISDLPDPIIHHIMSFLTTLDATKLSILSKSLYSLWGSFPVIDFDQSSFFRTYGQGTIVSKTNAFLDHILSSLKLRKTGDVISKFRVTDDRNGNLNDNRLDSAVVLALVNGVTCMELNLGFTKKYLLPMPTDFASKSLHVLRLEGLRLDLSKLIQVCPSLTTVSLKSCVIIRLEQDIEFSSKTLMEFEVSFCEVRSVKINASNLRSLTLSSSKPCEIDVLRCKNIMYLSLNNVVKGRDWIEEYVNTLGKLKTFILNGCEDIERIRVLNDKLERVELRQCRKLTSIELNAASLESFVFEGARELKNFPSVIEFLSRYVVCDITFLDSKHIKDLSLKGATFITDQWLEAQLAKMTSLRKLRLEDCRSLEKIKISHEKLQILEILIFHRSLEVDIDTPQLIYFVFEGHPRCGPCNITFLTSKHIKDLSINGTALVTDQWLETQLTKMTCLERLKLKRCDSLKKIKVFLEKLQILELDSCKGLVKADIDTPELVSFMYQGKMIEFGKMVTRSTCAATLSINPWITYDYASCCRWRELLSLFGSKALKITCENHKELMIPHIHRETSVSPLYDVQHLEIYIKSLEKIDIDLVDSLLWLSPHPQKLRISSGNSSQLKMIIKFVYNDVIEGEEDKSLFCCETKLVKCWKHNLKKLEIQSSEIDSIDLQKYFVTNAKIQDSSLCFSLADL